MSNIKITELAAPDAPATLGRFDPTKPVQTRDGRKARILATDLRGPFPIAFASENYAGDEDLFRCGPTGRVAARGACDNDLVNVRQQEVVDYWLVLSPDGDVWSYDSEHDALSTLLPSDVAVHIQRTFDL